MSEHTNKRAREEDGSSLGPDGQHAHERQRRYDEWREAKLEKLTRSKIDATVQRILGDLHDDGGSDLRWCTDCEDSGRSSKHGVHFSYVEGDLEVWRLEEWGCGFSDEWSVATWSEHGAVDPSELGECVRLRIEKHGCCVVTET